MPEKILYELGIEKMYQISSDTISRERIQLMNEIYKETTKVFPSLFALSVFGSLTKGKILNEISADKADVDYLIFINNDKIKNLKSKEIFENEALHNLLVDSAFESVKESMDILDKNFPSCSNKLYYFSLNKEIRQRVKDDFLREFPSKNHFLDTEEIKALSAFEDKTSQNELRENREEFNLLYSEIIQIYNKLRLDKKLTYDEFLSIFQEKMVVFLDKFQVFVQKLEANIDKIFTAGKDNPSWIKLKNRFLNGLKSELATVTDFKVKTTLISILIAQFINNKFEQKITENSSVLINLKKQGSANAFPIDFTLNSSSSDDLFNLVNFWSESTGSSVISDYEMSIDNAKIALTIFFGLDIGGGMKPLRKYVLEKMQNLKNEDKEKMWQNICKAVFYCRYKDTSSQKESEEAFKKQFPQTFEEAYNYFILRHK